MTANTPNRAYTYPCYTDPANFPAQMQDFATDVDTDIDLLVDTVAVARPRPMLRARIGVAGAGQVVPNAVTTALIWQTETFDTSAFMVAPSANVTFPFTGLYLVAVSYLWATDDSGRRHMTLVRTAPSVADLAHVQGSPGDTDLHGIPMIAMVPATVGDTMQVQVFQDGGVALEIHTCSLNISQVA